MQTSVCSFESLFLYRKQEKVMKAFLFNTLLFDYDRREGFLQPKKNLNLVYLGNIVEQLCVNCIAMFVKHVKQVRNSVKTSEKFLAKELITACRIKVY